MGVAHYYLGRIAAAQGRKEEARAHFAQAREMGQNSFVVQRLS
ncbi:MAG: tetratricopeptide repeat protein [Candidatus Omnitrophica bacterium]|nr:tetratricopeptide repeat protein [Candidatus Omnitrophota bacterium]